MMIDNTPIPIASMCLLTVYTWIRKDRDDQVEITDKDDRYDIEISR